MALLTEPVHALTDYQLEYDGLLLGPGTPYDLPPELNLLDLAPVRTQDTDRDPGFDGAFSGSDAADVAVFDVPFELYADTEADFATAVQALMRVASIRANDAPLWFKLPGLPVLGLGAKVNRRALPIGMTWSRVSRGALQLRSVRPWLQTVARETTLTPAGASGALPFPLFSPWTGAGAVLDFGLVGTAAYSAVLRNDGNAPAYPVVRVSGPTNGFTIALDGHTVTYPATVGADDVITLDYASGQAWLSARGTTAVQRTGLLTTRDFTAVPAGAVSTVVLIASGGTATVITADIWR